MKKLSELLREHLSPNHIVTGERSQIYKGERRTRENVRRYVVSRMSEYCDFRANVDDKIRDHLCMDSKMGPPKNLCHRHRDGNCDEGCG